MKLNEPVSLRELASILGAKFKGDPEHLILGINEIHKVEQGDLSFVDHPKYYEKCLNSAATTILINTDVEAPEGKGILISDDPFRDYNLLVNKFRPFRPSADMISKEARIGEGTVIQPGVFIGNHVTIGKDCIIHPNVTIYDHSVIGDRVVIHAGTVIGADAFYFKRRPEGFDKMRSCGRVIIADDVEIGACCTIDKGVSGDTVIGKGTKFDNQIHIGHDTVVGEHVLMAAQVGVAGVATIEDEVILWGQVGVSKDLTIGRKAIVYAQSGVPKSLEGGKVYFGSPVGEAREKMKEMAMIKRIPDLIKAVFRS
ncbi:MAG: UDP-3-O-(3-hydroxymyristoyl)glucosamine N-acyltransferase [Bacteroidetes bacterium]|nr:UDP-3-O-(3-hydroxymyristoyl)glucosamine N-acyltransferase [Bacteroidota bacterium]